MKKLLFALILVFLFQHIAYADELKGKGKRFEEDKAWIIWQTNKKWHQSVLPEKNVAPLEKKEKQSNRHTVRSWKE